MEDFTIYFMVALLTGAVFWALTINIKGSSADRKGKSSISVLNAKECSNFFKGHPPILSGERQRAIANQLEERCRIDLSQPS